MVVSKRKSGDSRFLDDSSCILSWWTDETSFPGVTVFTGQGGCRSGFNCLWSACWLWRVLQDELHDPGGILQGMRVVPDSRFANHLNTASQLFKSLFENGRILGYRNNLVCGSYHVQQGNFFGCQWFQVIDGVSLELQGFRFSQTVRFEASFPGAEMSFADPFASWPALDVADGCVAVDACDFIGIVIGPVVDDQPATAHPFQGNFPGELMLAGQVFIKIVPVSDGCCITEEVGNVAVGQMKTIFK